MSKTKTREEIITEFTNIWGDLYDYSKFEYVGAKVKSIIICREHGEFPIDADHHKHGEGCPLCGRNRTKNIIHGKGINDCECMRENGKELKSYIAWNRMLDRCYDEEYKKKTPTYIGCSVCEEWLHFSKFKEWYDKNYVEGYDLDKDLLFRGNKVYSPETCCFVPPEINKIILKRQRRRGEYPIGVHKQRNSFIAMLNRYGKQEYIGVYKTAKDAFIAYKQAKESYIKEVAQKYFGDNKITKRVYDALMKYEVEITD